MSAAVAIPLDSITGRSNAPPEFVCSTTEGGSVVAWVYVAGELDMATTPLLERALRERLLHARLIVLDLRDVTFMDTSGVHAIVDAGARARRRGRRLVILRGPPSVDRMLSLTTRPGSVEIGDVESLTPPSRMARVLLQHAAHERAA